MHRPIEGIIKTCTIKKESSGKWKISFSCEVETMPLPITDKAIPLDMGLENFAVLSNGEVISNPRFFKRGAKALAKAQRKLSNLEKGTKELSERVHDCSRCGYKATRDFNAALNILALGLEGLGEIPRSLCL